MFNPIILAAEHPSSTFGDMLIVTLSFLILLILLKVFAWDSVADMMNKRAKKDF